MTIGIAVFMYQTVEEQEEVEQRESWYSAKKIKRLITKTRNETTYEILARINSWAKDKRVINMETIWDCKIETGGQHPQYQHIDNTKAIGYRVFYTVD